jgi:hypothetical protein
VKDTGFVVIEPNGGACRSCHGGETRA